MGAAPRSKGRAAARPVVRVTTQGGPFAGASAGTIRRRADKMLAHLDLGAVELSIALVDDATIRTLNREYRRKDKPTDVLAFPLEDVAPGGAPQGGLLGDVILSIETARAQARRNRRKLLAELTMLLAHGLLHLIGYDHQTDAQEREMTARTRELEAAASRRGTAKARGAVRRHSKPAHRHGEAAAGRANRLRSAASGRAHRPAKTRVSP